MGTRVPRQKETVPAWAQEVAAVVCAIPRGQVLSYSQVALRAGMPGNPRGVVRALKLLKGVPWWRVVRADRTLAKEVASSQGPRLRREGVKVEGRKVLPKAAPKPRTAPTPGLEPTPRRPRRGLKAARTGS